jgi:hypothetical protein
MKDEGGGMKKEFVFIHPSSLILHPCFSAAPVERSCLSGYSEEERLALA